MTVPAAPIMLVEDDDALRHATAQGLELAGFAVRAFADAEQALARLDAVAEGAIVSDVRLPRMDGLEFLAAARALDPDVPMVIVTGHGDVAMAVTALKHGAYDFLTKPFAIDHLAATLHRALERRRLVTENRQLRAAAAAGAALSPLLGDSAPMRRARAAIRHLAAADVDVLVTGESGSGKDLAGTLLHRQGPRRARALITIDLAAMSAEQAELDLFGHAADSVAHTRLSRVGQLVHASGGTLLIDNVERASPAVQRRLLRAIEDREVLPTGGVRADPVDPRIVAMTRADLDREVAGGRFSAALLLRLGAFRIDLPPLRRRDADRLLLFAAFVEEAATELDRPGRIASAADRGHVLAHDWPGNVRELRQFALASVLREVRTGDAASSASLSLRDRTAAFERMTIVDALTRTEGNVVAALALLGTPRKTLYDKFVRYGIVPEDFRRDARREDPGEA